jgi:hypothetical protein
MVARIMRMMMTHSRLFTRLGRQGDENRAESERGPDQSPHNVLRDILKRANPIVLSLE